MHRKFNNQCPMSSYAVHKMDFVVHDQIHLLLVSVARMIIQQFGLHAYKNNSSNTILVTKNVQGTALQYGTEQE